MKKYHEYGWGIITGILTIILGIFTYAIWISNGFWANTIFDWLLRIVLLIATIIMGVHSYNYFTGKYIIR